MATLTAEPREFSALDDPLAVAVDTSPSPAGDVVQERCDELRATSWVSLPERQAPSVRPSSDAEKVAAALEFLRADQAKRRPRIRELERRAMAARIAEPAKARHYNLQQRCPAEDTESWFELADVADDLMALDSGAVTEGEARAVVREVERRLERIERRLSAPVLSPGGQTLHRHQWQRDEAHRQLEGQFPPQEPRQTRPNPSTAKRWPSDDRTGPASLVVRQPVLSNAPPSSDGPAHHLAAI